MVEGGPAMSIESTLRECEEIDLSDIAGDSSPRPSPRGKGRAVSVTCQCIFFVEWENHVQVTPLNRPLPPGEGWGEGLPPTSGSSTSSQPMRTRAARQFVTWLALALLAAPLSAQEPPARAAVEMVVRRFYSAYTSGDLEGLVAMWDPGSPSLAAF